MRVLSRGQASEAVEDIGWRFLLGAVQTSIEVTSFDQAIEVAAVIVGVCGADAETHLSLDLRSARIEVALQDAAVANVTDRDVELARSITAAVSGLGCSTGGVATDERSGRPVQAIELAIDALDIAAIRPFWKAVTAYVDEPGGDSLLDPVGQGPAIWFQQMDAPRPQRNRIHLDITVSHDEGRARVDAALAAGGVLVSDASARAFWVLADGEGNEVCVCTWQDRE